MYYGNQLKRDLKTDQLDSSFEKFICSNSKLLSMKIFPVFSSFSVRILPLERESRIINGMNVIL